MVSDRKVFFTHDNYSSGNQLVVELIELASCGLNIDRASIYQ